jgi:exopolysaccharide production protein ExoQ
MPQLILIGCYGFIVWLFWKDMAFRKAGTKALLIPGAWIAVQGSRPLSYWFGGGGGSDANPIDTLFFAGLIGCAIWVLVKQKLNWTGLVKQNKALFVIYFFLLCSMLWSEMPMASAKRIFKDFGCVLVGLIFLVQMDPPAAIRAVFVRVSYILFPLSLVFIKYFPEIGRQSNKAGETMFTGVTTQKNSLGETLFVFGIIVLWDLIEIWNGEKRKGKQLQIGIRVLILLMGFWLLKMCDSQTSILCLLIGGGLYWLCGRLLKMRKGKQILVGGLAVLICLAVVDKVFHLSEMVIVALGRDPNLTGRTEIWRIVLEQKTDQFLGNGYYTFWSSSKGQAVIEQFMQINSAHNGYLELYLDGGIAANILLCIVLLVAGGRVIDRLFRRNPLGRVGLIFWFLAIMYNFSESSYFRLDVLWFTFLLLIVASPLTRRQIALKQRLATAAPTQPTGAHGFA